MKRTSKKASFLLALVMIFGMMSNVYAAVLSDVSKHWAATYINWAVDTKLVDGYPDGTFKPEAMLTKAEFYKMVNRLADYKEKSNVSYSDVKSNDWFYNEVAMGIKAGYLTDNSSAHNPNTAITRDEASRIIAHVYGLSNSANSTNIFKDANTIQNRGAVGVLMDRKIINGYPDGNFRPMGNLKRAELSKILYTAVNTMGKPVVKKTVTTTVAPNKVQWDALKKSVADGRLYLSRVNQYRVSHTQIDQLRKAIDAAQLMINNYDRNNNITTYSINDITRATSIIRDAISRFARTTAIPARPVFTGYMVNFNSNGGTSIASQRLSQGSIVSRPTDPTRVGYRFDGWFIDSNFRTFYNFGSRVYNHITLYAKWTATDGYTVTFNSDGGTSIASQKLPAGSMVSRPTDPTKADYKFEGWFADSSFKTPYNFNSKIYSNITIYAKWTATDGYTVTFNSDGGTAIESEVVEKGKMATMPAEPTKDGYKFKEWQLNGAKYEFNKPVTSNITLKAIYDKNTATEYAITVINGESPLTKAVEGATVTIVAKVPEGHKFVKWTSEPSGLKDFNADEASTSFKMPASAVKLTAETEKKEAAPEPKMFTVTFKIDEHSAGSTQVESGKKISEPTTPTKDGYTFGGWKDESTGKAFDFNTAITKDVNLVAIWNAKTTATSTPAAVPVESAPTVPTTTTLNTVAE